MTDAPEMEGKAFINEYADMNEDSEYRTNNCYALSDLIYGENIARAPHASGEEFFSHWMYI